MAMSMSIRATAKIVQPIVDDDEGLSSLFIKWGPVGEYLDVSLEDGETRAYCEVFDQSNGTRFSSLSYRLNNDWLTLQVKSPESFVRGHQEQLIEVDLHSAAFDRQALMDCLKKILG